jgi:hypothetical protein
MRCAVYSGRYVLPFGRTFYPHQSSIPKIEAAGSTGKKIRAYMSDYVVTFPKAVVYMHGCEDLKSILVVLNFE